MRLSRIVIVLGCTGLLLLGGPSLVFAQNPTAGNTSKASRYYLEGVVELNRGALQSAATLFERAIRHTPRHAASYYRMSGIARMINDPKSALAYAREAHRLDPGFREYTDNYARTLALAEDYRGADSMFSILLANDPLNSDIQQAIIVLRYQQGRKDEALQMTDSLEQRIGIQLSLIDVKRQILIEKGLYRDAYEYLQQVVESYPDQWAGRVQLGELAAALGKDSIALASYHTAIDIDSTALPPRFALVEYYRINQRWPEFLEALAPVFGDSNWSPSQRIHYFETYVLTIPEVQKYFVSLIRLTEVLRASAPDDPTVREFYVRHLIYFGELDPANRYLLDQVEEGTATVDTYRNLIEIANYEGHKDLVAQYTMMALAEFPKDPNLKMTMLAVRLHQQDTLGAMAMAKEVIKSSGSDSLSGVAYGFYGDMLFLQGNKKEAFRFYEKALRISPDNANTLNNFAYYLSLENKDLERALVMADRANKLSPQNATYLDTQAWVLYQLGRYEEAQNLMRQALVLDTSASPELLIHYGDILFALGSEFMAQTYWQRALEAGADGPAIVERLNRLNRETGGTDQ